MHFRLFAFSLLLLPVAAAFGQPAIEDQPAFSVPAETLQKAFAGIEAGSNPVTVLLDQATFEFDDAGKLTSRHHTIFKVWTKAAAEGWAMVQSSWGPWDEDRPVVRARVVSADGSVHELDPKTMADSPVREGDDTVLSDRRMVKAPLPAMEPGSVVEQETVEHHTRPPLVGGVVKYFYFGRYVPVQRTLVTIRGPETMPFRYHVRLLPAVKVKDEKKDGRREIAFDQGPMKPLEDGPPLLPSNEPEDPHVVFSTGADWKSIATGYSAVMEKQIQGFNAASWLPKFTANASREAKIRAIVEKLNKEIRYTGIEFGESEQVPHTPAEVIERKFGDCKDKSSLAVALLRSAGIDAYVAMLLSSNGQDIEPDLPGMEIFNHAIVYVPGTPDIWLDPTDPDLRVGVVSPPNQGRLSLIARTQTTALIKTPEMGGNENRIIETREFVLSELGKAKVTESTETFGTSDRDYRGSFSDREEKALRESLKQYADWVYGEPKIDAVKPGNGDDLSKPYTLRIEMSDASRGISARTEAAVGIFPSQMLQRLPNFFRQDPEKAPKKEDDKPKPVRTQDFEIPEPITWEWNYKITAPPGFRLRQVPEAKSENLGPATLSVKFARETDALVTGTVRFVIPKRRFTAAEGLALRDAALELEKRKAILIFFDQVGETDLQSGDVRGALAEFNTLRKLHPRESLHSLQTARAMLAAGAGVSARAEARRAVELEPTSAKGYLQLAEILKHDLVGRPLEKGYDLEGAIAAYRKSLELDPKDDEARANFAILLEHNRDGIRYGEGSNLAEAIAEYRKLGDKLAGLNIPSNLQLALFRAGQMGELREYLRKQPNNELNHTLRVCAEAVLGGTKAAVDEAGSVSGVGEKQRVLASAGQTLISIRRYDLAADLLEASAAGAENPAGVANAVQVLRKAKRIDDLPGVLKEPEDAVRLLMFRAMRISGHEKDWTEPMSSYLLADQQPDELKGLERTMGAQRGKFTAGGLSVESAFDIGQSSIQFARDGSDENGYLLRVSAPGGSGAGSRNQVFFLNMENGVWKVLAANGQYSGVGHLALALVEAGQADKAKIWLDRVRTQVRAGSGDDPIDGAMFARLWTPGQRTANPELIRRAAAALLPLKPAAGKADVVLAILEESNKNPDAASAAAVAASLGEAFLVRGQYAKSLTLFEQLEKDLPFSTTAFIYSLRAAYGTGLKKDSDRIAKAGIERFQDNPDALRSAASVAMTFGDTDRSSGITKQLIDSGKGNVGDYNQLAWGDLMAGKVTAASLEAANKGMLLSNNQSASLMHTLAAVDAEIGKEGDARATMMQRLKAEGTEEPGDDDWYVFGRIAEQYGLREDAAAMYRRLTKPANELAIASSSYALAQKRLKAMGN